MSKITIFTDSCSSLTTEIIEKHNIKVIPIFFTFNGEEYNPLEEKIATEDFYNALETNIARTACISPSTFKEYFEAELKKGNQVVYVSMSSGLSATYNNAVTAQKELLESYPNQIEIIDSLKGGMGMAFDIEKIAELRDNGASLEQIKKEVDKNGEGVECLFTPGSIDYLKRSGRINPPAALLAKVMNINPLINADKNGKLAIKGLCIGRKKTLIAMINKVKASIHEKMRKIYLCYTNNKQEADFVSEKLNSELSNAEIKLSTIDCSLGCHCGPRTLAIFFKKKANAN